MKIKSSLVTLMVLLISTLYSPFVCSGTPEEALIEKANTFGSVRVIVRLNTDYKMEGKLSSSQAVQDQRSRISQEQGKLLSRLVSHDLSGVKKFATIPYLAMKVNPAALDALSKDPGVVSIVEDKPVPPTLQQSIPFINADDVHVQGFDGSGITVAVLDTGVLNTHEFLDAGKVVSEACYSTPDATYSATSLCPNGLSSQIGPGAGVNCDPAMSSTCSHGTHVAGIVAGTGGAPGVGVAPAADIIAIQVFSRLDSAYWCEDSPVPCVRTFESDQMSALERVYDLQDVYNIAAANMSLGGGNIANYCDTNPLKDLIDNLRSAGIATVISSGNSGYDGAVGAPGCISTAVTVGATLNDSNIIASYSNHAYMVDLMAPGSDIYSSIATGTAAYELFNGTSMAAPHVAGAFAIMKQKFPTWSVTNIETALKTTGVDVTRDGIIKPRIDLLAATVPPEPAEGDLLDLVLPSIIAAVKPQWGAYTKLCCGTSSLTYGVTQGIQYRSSTLATCASEASFSGYLATTPGSKYSTHRLTSSGCVDLVGSGWFTLDAGRRYLWVAELVSGEPVYNLYSESRSSFSANTPAGGVLSGDSVPESMRFEFSGPLVPVQAAPEGDKFQSITHP